METLTLGGVSNTCILAGLTARRGLGLNRSGRLVDWVGVTGHPAWVTGGWGGTEQKTAEKQETDLLPLNGVTQCFVGENVMT